jgi:hypothetical protein
MPNLVFGYSRCPICGKVIEKDDPIIAFAAFAANKESALRVFSDAVLHKTCFDSHPRAKEIRQVYDSVQSKR